MSGERVERRLAAILAADVAGYSRLMGEDEAGTLARLRSHRHELIAPKVAKHKGRIVKTTGDGILIEFPSVVEAVACAVAVQCGMAERNVSVREDQRIVFRVGVKLDLTFDDLGEQEFKNIVRPLRVYRVRRLANGETAPTSSMVEVSRTP